MSDTSVLMLAPEFRPLLATLFFTAACAVPDLPDRSPKPHPSSSVGEHPEDSIRLDAGFRDARTDAHAPDAESSSLSVDAGRSDAAILDARAHDASSPDAAESTAAMCARLARCDECAAASACGFCESTGQCLAGTFEGPSSGTCVRWDYVVADCTRSDGGVQLDAGVRPDAGPPPPPDPCATDNTCGGCAARSGCGWCEDDRACRSGSTTGPTRGTCARWDYLRSSCPPPPDPCSVNTSCGDCAAQSSCGYCADDGTCRTGASTGPAIGSCAQWTFVSSGC